MSQGESGSVLCVLGHRSTPGLKPQTHAGKSLPCSNEFSFFVYFLTQLLKIFSFYTFTLALYLGLDFFIQVCFFILTWNCVSFCFLLQICYSVLLSHPPLPLSLMLSDFFSSLETFLVEFHIFLKISQFTVFQNFKRMWVWAFSTHCLGIPMACSVLKRIFLCFSLGYFLAFSLMITSFQFYFLLSFSHSPFLFVGPPIFVLLSFLFYFIFLFSLYFCSLQ